jgi:tetratricopeptide (TPR) repeat protein
MSGSTDWLSAIGILLSGLVLGAMFIYVYVRRRQNTAAASKVDLELAELQAKRDALIEQLRELDDSGDATAEERRRLEMKTADVLRTIDRYKPSKGAKPVSAAKPGAAPAIESVAPTGYFARNPAVKGFLFGVGSVAALAFLGYYVYHSSQQRGEGQGATGGTGMQPQGTASQAPARPDPAILQLEAAVKSAPDDIDKRIDLARAYLDRENMMGVFEQTKAVLDKNPNDPRAQTYNAIVRMTMGQTADAKKMLDAATKSDGSIIDAWVAIAWIATKEGRPKDAEAAIDNAIKAHPDQAARLREVLGQMQGHAQQAKASPLSPGAEGQPLPPGHPPVDPNAAPATAMANAAVGGPMGSGSATGGAPAAAPGSAPPAADAVHITLNIDPKANPKSGIVFVFARPEGQAGGPPIAVKRLNVASFPTKVEFSSSDSMMGDPLPSKMHLEAHLSSSGDVTIKKPTDPKAVADGIATKSAVTLTLK